MQLTENEVFTSLYVLSILAVILLIVIGDVIISKAKEARLEQAKERAREADLFARYQRMHEPPLDYDALQAELDEEFAALSVDKAARLSA
jgi:hypothetical protein